MYKQLHSFSLPFGLSHVAISQRLAVACAIGNTVQVTASLAGLAKTVAICRRMQLSQFVILV